MSGSSDALHALAYQPQIISDDSNEGLFKDISGSISMSEDFHSSFLSRQSLPDASVEGSSSDIISPSSLMESGTSLDAFFSEPTSSTEALFDFINNNMFVPPDTQVLSSESGPLTDTDYFNIDGEQEQEESGFEQEIEEEQEIKPGGLKTSESSHMLADRIVSYADRRMKLVRQRSSVDYMQMLQAGVSVPYGGHNSTGTPPRKVIRQRSFSNPEINLGLLMAQMYPTAAEMISSQLADNVELGLEQDQEQEEQNNTGLGENGVEFNFDFPAVQDLHHQNNTDVDAGDLANNNGILPQQQLITSPRRTRVRPHAPFGRSSTQAQMYSTKTAHEESYFDLQPISDDTQQQQQQQLHDNMFGCAQQDGGLPPSIQEPSAALDFFEYAEQSNSPNFDPNFWQRKRSNSLPSAYDDDGHFYFDVTKYDPSFLLPPTQQAPKNVQDSLNDLGLTESSRAPPPPYTGKHRKSFTFVTVNIPGQQPFKSSSPPTTRTPSPSQRPILPKPAAAAITPPLRQQPREWTFVEVPIKSITKKKS